ncbi:hypothetical protein C8Q77DRAFT_1062169 [Trametes polyzona]|nr:hypothetical protein C8Q77DRAFT_1062169 [Trametes polyzona]
MARRASPDLDSDLETGAAQGSSGAQADTLDSNLDKLPDAADDLVPLLDYVLDSESREFVPAFQERADIRLLYLQVVLANVFGSATVDESEQRLRDGLDLLALSSEGLPTRPKPAETLATAKKRLGLNVDDYLYRRAICSECFKPYRAEDIANATSPACVVKKCPGVFYRMKHNVDGKERRMPAKAHTYVSLMKTLQRFFLRPDFIRTFTLPSTKLGAPPLSDQDYMHDFHDGAAFGAYILDNKRVVMPDGSVTDVAIRRGSQRTLMSVDIGISMTINVDWYGVTEGRPHSVGGIYVTFNNLDRTVRYLQHNVHLSQNTPGPKEPSNEQMIHLIEPLYEEAKELYNGVLLAVAGRAQPAEVYGGVEMRICDLPGSRKLKAAAAHNHKNCPCFFCKVTHEDINSPAGYDVENFELRDDWEQVANAFAWRDAKTEKERKRLFEENGQRWAKFFELPGWLPSGCAIDFMHNFYLGIAKEMYMAFLVRGYLLNKEMWRSLEETVNSIRWPSGIGRLPTNLGENHGFAKADQWRRFVNVQSTILWTVWGNGHDEIRHTPPAPPANAKKVEGFSRSDLREIYEVFLFASVAERVLASKSISMDEVKRGHAYLRRCCERMLELGIHLLPNHHLAMHYPEIFRLFGPVYAWWLYAHERFNGIQEKVRINGKAGGEMELTLTRNWVAKQRLYELLTSLPESASVKERELIDRVIANNTQSSGTLRTHMFAGSDSSVKVPARIKKPCDLRKLPHQDVYQLLLDFVRRTFPDHSIANDFNIDATSITFSSTRSAWLFPIISVKSTRFGSVMDKRSSNDRFGCVNFETSRIPCKILYHFKLSVGGFIPVFPWSLYSIDLGVYVAHADRFQPLEVIMSSQLSAPVAIIPIFSKALGDAKPLWAVHSFDRVRLPPHSAHVCHDIPLQTGIEPEDEWFNSLDDEIDSTEDEGEYSTVHTPPNI